MIEKIERNSELVQKRVTDPKKWGWGALGKHYGIKRQVAKETFEAHVGKYASKEQIRAYEKLVARRLQRV